MAISWAPAGPLEPARAVRQIQGMGHAQDDGIPMGAPVGVLDPVAAAECTAAQERRYAECIAAGMTERAARFEGIGAAAQQRRVQLGLPAVPDDPYYVPPTERFRVDARGRVIPPKARR